MQTEPNETSATVFPVKVAAALLVAQSSLKNVAKGSENKFHNYKYAGAEDVLTEARSHLHEAGLMVLRDSAKVLEDQGTPVLHSVFIVVHESGEAIVLDQEFPVVPGNGRPMDKAVAASLTTSMSYFLRDLLLIPRVDGEEVDTRDDRAYTHQPRKTEKKTKKSTKTAPNKTLLANEIKAIASEDQLERMYDALGNRGLESLEELEIEELRTWSDKLKESKK